MPRSLWVEAETMRRSAVRPEQSRRPSGGVRDGLFVFVRLLR